MTHEKIHKLEQAYQRMAERLHQLLGETDTQAGEAFKKALLRAQEEARALMELTKKESEQVAYWLKRDLHAMAKYISQTQKELREWLPVEVEAEGSYLWDRLMSTADQTTLELLELKEEAELASFELWRTGEVTGPGILECAQCGEKIHFQDPGHIPPCPKCHHTIFARIADALPQIK